MNHWFARFAELDRVEVLRDRHGWERRTKGGAGMIVTVTPNPSIDRTIEVAELVRGAVLRAVAGHVDPGGKGVNVARALAANGRKARAVLPSGGAEGRQLAELLGAAGIDVASVPVRDPVRVNVAVVEPDGTTTKLNELGPNLSPAEVEALIAATVAGAEGSEWVACCGSLPPGAGDDFYARLAARVAETGSKVALDSSGPAFTAALTARPALVKPNHEELAEAAGMPVGTLGEVADAAKSLLDQGVATVVVSLGADGALLVNSDGVVHGEAPADRPRSTVGAGDALLAGFLAAGGSGPSALAEGLAWGTAAVQLPGSRMPTPDDLDHDNVRLHDSIQRERPIGD
jgi:1-phosphofructokinase